MVVKGQEMGAQGEWWCRGAGGGTSVAHQTVPRDRWQCTGVCQCVRQYHEGLCEPSGTGAAG